MGNLKPAPLPLTPALAAKLAGDRPAFGMGIARLPIEGTLVDRPRRSEDPRLAQANDDQGGMK